MIQVKIKAAYTSMTPSEKRIAEYILKNRDKLTDVNSYSLAKATKTGQATVIRFSKAIGYSHFQEFILDLRTGESTDIIERDIHIQDDIITTNTKMVQSYTATLNFILEQNKEDAFQAALSLILTAQKIIILGIGSSGLAGLDFANKLLKYGKPAFYNSDIHMALSLISNAGPDDLVIVFSASGMKKEILIGAKKAKEVGAKVLAITGLGKNKLAKDADATLYITNFSHQHQLDATTSRIGQFIIADMLFIHYIKANHETYQTFKHNSENVLKKYD